MTVLFGLYHGLLFLPVMLLLFGSNNADARRRSSIPNVIGVAGDFSNSNVSLSHLASSAKSGGESPDLNEAEEGGPGAQVTSLDAAASDAEVKRRDSGGISVISCNGIDNPEFKSEEDFGASRTK